MAVRVQDAAADLAEAAGPRASCEETPVARSGPGAVITFEVQVMLGGKRVIFGEKNALPGGGSLTPTNLRFYISDPQLLGPAGKKTAVDLVGGDGRPMPYNVHMVNLEESASLRLRLRAPEGGYSGLGFLLGLNDTCNGSDPALRKAPLTPASQMTWPHPGLGLGYLFLRYEAMVAGAGPSAPPGVIHMGGQVRVRFAPEVSAAGSVQAVADQPLTYLLQVSLDEIFKGAAMPADLDGFFGPPGAEVIAGEHLRQNVGKVAVFKVVAAR